MRTLNEQIERLRELVRKCYGVVYSKNGEVPEVGERTIANLPDAIASTHDTLEELTITENGTYTPQKGVDGFSKVTARVLPTKRVVIPNGMRVTNDLIVDGYWAGELVDTSKMTTMSDMFNNCQSLQYLDVSNWDVSKVTNMNRVFRDCYNLLNIDVSNWDVSKVTSMEQMFNVCRTLQNLDVSNWDVSKVTNMHATFFYCYQLQNLDVSKWDVSGVTSMRNMFNSCYQLRNLDVSNWDVSKVTSMQSIFYDCSQLQTLINNRTIDDVLANNIIALNGLKVDLALNQTILDRASLRAVINGLADLTGQDPKTLTLGSKLIAKLTEEDIAIATNKNWTLS